MGVVDDTDDRIAWDAYDGPSLCSLAHYNDVFCICGPSCVGGCYGVAQRDKASRLCTANQFVISYTDKLVNGARAITWQTMQRMRSRSRRRYLRSVTPTIIQDRPPTHWPSGALYSTRALSDRLINAA